MLAKEVESVPEEPVEGAEGVWVRWLISRRDGAPNFAMRLFRFEPGASMAPHSHPWEHEIYVLSGRVVVTVGGEEVEAGPGTALLVPPNVEHSYRNPGEEDAVFICVIPLSGVPPGK